MFKDLNIVRFNTAFFLRAMMLLYPVMLLFYQQNGLSAQEFLFFQGGSYLTSILAEAPVGYLSNTISRKYLLVISFTIYLGITFLWIFLSGYYVVLVGEILFGISKIMMDNVMSGYLYDYLDRHDKEAKMAKYYGYLNFYLALGTALAGILGTIIYTKFGMANILWSEVFIIGIIIALVFSLPNIKSDRTYMSLKQNVRDFLDMGKKILANKDVKYHIFFSGFLTSCSILFSLSFQPMIQNAFLPVFMFGVVAFLNHFVRSIASAFAGKFSHFNLKKIAISLLGFYTVAFLLILRAFEIKTQVFTSCTIVLICLFIGIQLVFTILHISRLHTFVTIENRGVLMAINNLVSRTATAIILITSKIFVNKSEFELYYLVIFTLFLILCSYLAVKIQKVEG